MTGFVSLVGAGPGDPDLLTLKAARRLADADLVLHDALVSPEILTLAAGAERVSVGKRAGRPSAAQDAINRSMIRAASDAAGASCVSSAATRSSSGAAARKRSRWRRRESRSRSCRA